MIYLRPRLAVARTILVPMLAEVSLALSNGAARTGVSETDRVNQAITLLEYVDGLPANCRLYIGEHLAWRTRMYSVTLQIGA